MEEVRVAASAAGVWMEAARWVAVPTAASMVAARRVAATKAAVLEHPGISSRSAHKLSCQ